MKTALKLFLIFWMFSFASFAGIPPKSLTLNPSKSTVKVTGTSTLHDWEIKVNKFDGNSEMLIENNLITGISSLKINFYSKSFSSGKDLMDEKAQEAVKVNSYEKITFELVKVVTIKTLNGIQQITATGDLTIAGVKKSVTTVAYCQINSSGEMNITGAHSVDMTQFGVDPPTAIMGTIKTGKTVSIKYNITLK